MAGNKQTGQKLVETMIKKYGSYEAYKQSMRERASKGGKNGNKKLNPNYSGGFAGDTELAKRAGAKAGEISRRGLKFIKEDNGVRIYIALDTGKVVEYMYDSDSKEYKRKN